GAGHKIKGLTITDVKADYQGLFGNSNGTIRNFSIEGTISSESGDFYGGVAGFNSGTIENVISNVNITGKAYNVGGIAGLSTSGIWVIAGSNRVNEQFVIEGATGKISNCGWEGTELSATNKVGGIVGENAGYVSKCYSGAGKISAPGSGKGGAGGIVGRNGCNNEAYETGFVDSCYSFATVGSAGDRWFGGIVGFQNNKYGYSAKTEVSSTTNCYFAGTIVTGGYSSNWGPIVGAYDSAAQGYDNNYSLDTVISGDNKEITTGIRKTEAEMASPAFAELLGENFKASCGYPVLAWQDAKEHTPADAVEETVEPTYSKIGSIDTVVYCSECGAELSREAVKTDDSLKDQADAAIEAAEEALAAAEASSGEEAAELAETAAELAAEAKEAAKAALDAAQAEGNEEAIAEAKEAYDKADEVNDAAVIEQAEAIYAAESAIDNKNAAASALASIESAVEIDKYNGETAGSYKAAVTALKTLINDKKATASQLKKALLQVSQAYVNLTEKSVNTVTAAAKAKTVKAKKLKKKAMTVSGAVTVKDPVGTVTYAKAAGSAKQLSVNAKTGKITVKKKTKKGTYKIKVKVGASGNEDFFAGSQTVTVKIKVK
ncbi:MAG: hypothetical protein IJ128_06945, partial [Firmicutes bacterium]|nr:hypothetical protein [Bacillota bacterium]